MKKKQVPWNKGLKQEFRFCKECGEYKEHTARGLCSSCYRRWRETIGNKIICKICGKTKPHIARGMCGSCYEKWHRENMPNLIICKVCRKLKPHESKGMCGQCYKKNRPKRICKLCGELRPTTRKGICKRCYDVLYFSTKEGRLAKEKYNKSEKCKKYLKKYSQSERGKEVRLKCERSPKGKIRKKKYHQSIKGRLVSRRAGIKRVEREKNIINIFTPTQWKQKVGRAKGFCAICKTYVGKEKLGIDHIYPISVASSDYDKTGIKRSYKINDVQPVCKSCNSSKNNKIIM